MIEEFSMSAPVLEVEIAVVPVPSESEVLFDLGLHEAARIPNNPNILMKFLKILVNTALVLKIL